MDEWDVYQTSEVASWLAQLQADDPKTADLVDDAIYALSCSGPALGVEDRREHLRDSLLNQPVQAGRHPQQTLAAGPWSTASPAPRSGT